MKNGVFDSEVSHIDSKSMDCHATAYAVPRNDNALCHSEGCKPEESKNLESQANVTMKEDSANKHTNSSNCSMALNAFTGKEGRSYLSGNDYPSFSVNHLNCIDKNECIKVFIDNKEFIKVFIDNKECYAHKGESLLNVARRHGIAIPTLCDLKKLTPTGACRMCVVEEEDGNIIASCKSFVNKEARIYTNTQKLQKYRNQIMSFLCINHPLECGVCDKSGECELQDKVLESKVAIQPFFAIQKQNDFVHFHNKVYNESLCIMCERCARTCNEFVGNSVLSVIAGGFHSKIGVDFNAYCEDCDECVSVCPTGAMFSSRFTYTSNAWELEKTHSHCPHCSLNCPMHYEIKHNIDSKKQVYRIKNEAHIGQLCHAGRHNFLPRLESVGGIESQLDLENVDCFVAHAPRNDERGEVDCHATAYAVPRNDDSPCHSDLERSEREESKNKDVSAMPQHDKGACHSNLDNISCHSEGCKPEESQSMESQGDSQNDKNFSNHRDKGECIQGLIGKIDSIRLGTHVTNEEAYLANLLAQRANKKLYCDEALRYKEFMQILESFGTACVLNLNNASRESVHIVLGGYLYDEMPILRSDLSKCALKNGAKNVWISPISEDRFSSDLSITYEVGSEFALSVLLLDVFADRLRSIACRFESSYSEVSSPCHSEGCKPEESQSNESQYDSKNMDCHATAYAVSRNDEGGVSSRNDDSLYMESLNDKSPRTDNTSCHSDLERSEREESKNKDVSATPQHDKKETQYDKGEIQQGKKETQHDKEIHNHKAQYIKQHTKELITKTLAFLQEQDLAYIMAESNVSESELQRLAELCLYHKELDFGFQECSKVRILVTRDFYLSSEYRQIAQILALLSHVGCEIAVINYQNVAGIASICDLSNDTKRMQRTLGIRTEGEYSISPTSSMRIAPMQFMEGSLIDLYGNFVKLYPSYVDCDIADLLDIVGEYLGLDCESMVDLVGELPFITHRNGDSPCHSEAVAEESQSNESQYDSKNVDCHADKSARNDGEGASPCNGDSPCHSDLDNSPCHSDLDNSPCHSDLDNSPCHSEAVAEESQSNESRYDSKNVDCHATAYAVSRNDGEGALPCNDGREALSRNDGEWALPCNDDKNNMESLGLKSRNDDTPLDFDRLQSKFRVHISHKGKSIAPAEYNEITLGEGSGIYIYNAAMSGNLSFYRREYSNQALLHDNKRLHGVLKVSKQFCLATKLSDNDVITLDVNGYAIKVRVLLTSFMKGMVAVMASDCIIDSKTYFDYKRA